MHFLRFLWIIVASFLDRTMGYGLLKIFGGHHLPTENISYSVMGASSICYCKIFCFSNPNCNTVTVHTSSLGEVNCFFCPSDVQLGKLQPNSSSFTITRPVCNSPFKMIEDVGCLYENHVEELTWPEADAKCKNLGARLFIPQSVDAFNRFGQYAQQKLTENAYSAEFWLGGRENSWSNGEVPENSTLSGGTLGHNPRCYSMITQEALVYVDLPCLGEANTLPYVCQKILN